MKRSLWILAAILILAAAMRFFQLDAQSFWNDEGTSARVAERSLPLITAAAIGDIHPPLYYYALHFWRGAFGESEFALRSFSAILGVVLVWLIYLLGARLLDESTALVAAFIAAVNPFQLYYSQEARMYILLAVWAAASTYFLIRLVGQNSILPSIGYVLTAAAGMYTHYAFPFVLIVHNLSALAWLITQRKGWYTWATWAGLQVAVVALYGPWLGIALQRLPEWKSPASTYQLGPALLDTFRWLAFGRTIATAPTLYALGAIALLIIVSLLPSRSVQHATLKYLVLHPSSFIPHPSPLILLAWCLVPIALIFTLGLYKDAYLKFLLVCSPAFCLLFAHGIVAAWRMAGNVKPFVELGSGAGSPAQTWQAIVTALLVVVAIPSLQSISNLYFDPAYARDNYRGIAQRIKQEARPGDVILLEADNQWETFTYYYRGDIKVIPFGNVRPVTEQAAADELSRLTEQYKRLFVSYWAETEPDPQRFVERWLEANTFKASETWYGTVRLAVYAVPTVLADGPDHSLDTRFGDSIRLTGYSISGGNAGAGDILQLALFWQADAPIAARYKVFVHVLGADDKLVTQIDREPGGGLVPTTIWQPGHVITDRYGIMLPSNAAPGHYRIAIGMYGFDGVRLTTSAGDRVILTDITVP